MPRFLFHRTFTMRWFLSTLLFGAVAVVQAASYTGSRLLVVLEDVAEREKYSVFLGDVEGKKLSILRTECHEVAHDGATVLQSHTIGIRSLKVSAKVATCGRIPSIAMKLSTCTDSVDYRQRLPRHHFIAQVRFPLSLQARRASIRPCRLPSRKVERSRSCPYCEHDSRLHEEGRKRPRRTLQRDVHPHRRPIRPPRTRYSHSLRQGRAGR